MRIIRTSWLLWVLTAAGLQVFCSHCSAAAASEEENGLLTQIEINRHTLFEDPNEQIRIKAAILMLSDRDSLSRGVLLEALDQNKNIAAREAVCKALIQARASGLSIKDKDDFINPLAGMLLYEQDSTRAKLAAEATLVFEYKDISPKLESILDDSKNPIQGRLNVVYALKIQPDMRAIFKLIDLLGSNEPQIATESEQQLLSLGIPIGRNGNQRDEIKSELKKKGRDAFIRDWQLRQERRVNELEIDLDFWKSHYIGSLNKIYSLLPDEPSKTQLLLDNLVNARISIRKWALDKTIERRNSTNPEMPAELGSALLNLISDENRDIRLKTANLLSISPSLDSSGKLLEQLKVEQDEAVKMELVSALGGACQYALSPNSGITLAAGVRQEALSYASQYLVSDVNEKAILGAEVLRKLLEQNGLSVEESNGYLVLLLERYKRDTTNYAALKAGLLNVMSSLCAQSYYKEKTRELFVPLFNAALDNKVDSIREAAVGGLIASQKAEALKVLRGRELYRDNSQAIRKKVINLAGEAGSSEDLQWLWQIYGQKPEADIQIWEQMRKILERSGADVVNQWLGTINSNTVEGKVSEDRIIGLLDIVVAKAESENKAQLLNESRKQLALIYRKRGNYDKSMEYFVQLRDGAASAEEKEADLAEIMVIHLLAGNLEAAKQLISSSLLEKDLGDNHILVVTISKALSGEFGPLEAKGILAMLEQIDATGKQMWQEKLKGWHLEYTKSADPNTVASTSG